MAIMIAIINKEKVYNLIICPYLPSGQQCNPSKPVANFIAKSASNNSLLIISSQRSAPPSAIVGIR